MLSPQTLALKHRPERLFIANAEDALHCQVLRIDGAGLHDFLTVIKGGKLGNPLGKGGLNRKITERKSVFSIAMFDYQRVATENG